MAGKGAQTPLMRQYLDIKAQHPDSILFFRMGDFYEMFFEDAKLGAQALELTLTSRDKNSPNPVPMAGVPHHAARGYIARLLEQGHRVAICDQVEDPKLARGLVKRAVTQVVTPGLVFDSDHLEAKRNNYLVALHCQREGRSRVLQHWSLAALDISTAELRLTCGCGTASLNGELSRLAPSEILFAKDTDKLLKPLRDARGGAWQELPSRHFSSEGAREELEERSIAVPLPLAPGDERWAVGAAALRYARLAQPERPLPKVRLECYTLETHLQLDDSTLSHLEIFETQLERQKSGSLWSVLDQTVTAMGGRTLRRWLTMPLRSIETIRRRQDAIACLVEERLLRAKLRQMLRSICDIERLTSRCVLALVTPRELGRLGAALEQVGEIGRELDGFCARQIDGQLADYLRWPDDRLDDVARKIRSCLVDDPPQVTKDGGLIRPGYDDELDRLNELCDGGRNQILRIEQKERQRTGIPSLRIRYNRVFGYFIEVSRAKLRDVPGDYRRKQTLANAERFVTDELGAYEIEVLQADEQRIRLEQAIFEALRQEVAAQGVRLLSMAERVAMIDVFSALAELAGQRRYVRPTVDDSRLVDITQGRHPVVEQSMDSENFVPNDIRIDDDARLLMLTGPNMSGKSTIMRQVALTVVMAQVGSFVPAQRCRLGVVDRIFTRVGAADNLARGESTFMVEMRETANILTQATSESLVVLDEIGRGTSTYDGISIAWAVAETLHDEIQARTLFATHYHELCALADLKKGIVNRTMAIEHWRGKVVFQRRFVEGACSRSFGLEVARLAGIDARVLERAQQILLSFEDGLGQPMVTQPRSDCSPQMTLFSPATSAARDHDAALALCERLRQIDVDHMTPVQALTTLAELVNAAEFSGRAPGGRGSV